MILKNSSLYLLLHHKRGSYILVVVSSLVSSDAHGICLVLQTAPSLSLGAESMALLARLCVYERPALSCLSGFIFIFCTVLGCHALPRLHTARTPAPAPAPTTPGASVNINYDPSDGRILGSTLSPSNLYSSASYKCDVACKACGTTVKIAPVKLLVLGSQTNVVCGLLERASEFSDKQTQSLL